MRLRCARCGCYVSVGPKEAFIEAYIGQDRVPRVAPCARCLRKAEIAAVRDFRRVQRTVRVLRGEGE